MRSEEEISAKVRLLQNQTHTTEQEKVQLIAAANALLWVLEISDSLNQLTPGA